MTDWAKIAKQLYPPDDLYEEYGRTIVYDYGPIVEYFGNVVCTVDVGEYQGDTLVLYEFDDGTYGLLVFGWGTCHVCDALQGCNSYNEIGELIEDLYNSIKRFNTAEVAFWYIAEKPWENEYFYYVNVDDVIKFIREALYALNERMQDKLGRDEVNKIIDGVIRRLRERQ